MVVLKAVSTIIASVFNAEFLEERATRRKTYPKSSSVESLNWCSIFNSFNDHFLFICLKKGWYTADRFCKLDRRISTRIKPFMSVKLWLLWPINRINFVWTLDSALLAHFTFNFPCFTWSEDYYSESPQWVNSLKKYSTIPVRALIETWVPISV